MSEQRLELVPVTAASAPNPAPSTTANETTTPADAPTRTNEPAAVPEAAPRSRRARTRRTAPAATAVTPKATGEDPWRQWERPGQTFSYRLPPELIEELEERLWQLRIREIGVTVAAAITHLLDLDDDELRELVDRADAAKPRRRAAGRPPRT